MPGVPAHGGRASNRSGLFAFAPARHRPTSARRGGDARRRIIDLSQRTGIAPFCAGVITLTFFLLAILIRIPVEADRQGRIVRTSPALSFGHPLPNQWAGCTELAGDSQRYNAHPFSDGGSVQMYPKSFDFARIILQID